MATPEAKELWDQRVKGLNPYTLYYQMLKDRFEERLISMALRVPKGPILDLGCGPSPLSSKLAPLRELICLDLSPTTVELARATFRFSSMHLFVAGDIEDTTLAKFSSRRAAVNLLRFFDYSKEELQQNPEVLGAVVMSDVLNYIDWRHVLPFLAKHLKKGGNFAICNAPGRGEKQLFHPQKPGGANEICSYLEGIGFTILEDADLITEEYGFPSQDESIHAIFAEKTRQVS